MQVFVPKEELSLNVIKQYRVVSPMSLCMRWPMAACELRCCLHQL